MFFPKKSSLDLSEKEFKEIGYQLVDSVAHLVNNMSEMALTTNISTEELRDKLVDYTLLDEGVSAKDLFDKTTQLLINYSLFNGHPKFMGFITSAPSPIGILADFLGSAINPNVSAQILSPIATEIEKQTIEWISSFIGLNINYGGLLVSGGNMANFTGFLAARTAKIPKDFKEKGFSGLKSKLIVYCSKATHTWIEKAVVLFGHGLNSVRWIPTNTDNRIDEERLENAIKQDLKDNNSPFMVVGTAGDVSTGAVDNLDALAELCKKYNLWFHIDGAYGAPAAALPELNETFAGITQADSIALDPHKWLYAPLEAGCILVKNPEHLTNTFSSRPEYYKFDGFSPELAHNFYEYGMQNSRGFRALKVWLMLQHSGKNGILKAIRKDIQLSKLFFDLAIEHPNLEALTQNLSITTLRYVPTHDNNKNKWSNLNYLNSLNEQLLGRLQKSGELFLSNAIVKKKFCLRACIVNFKTSKKDIEECIDIIVKTGEQIHFEMSSEYI
ncbi:pyridoxal phosphate-dependent decarboxylase family protein [Winogradskyella vincentii]|uniref:Pyridoxal-dependent decarboxylase domain-containing protein 1 n=1 Tax=Winogradskyella vincentii TaxID=2877122 RepID=A0ABS7Y118_9FLAO|nr:pyridoxal-dependent decarboxylase [Winogradskyella vincentii]MCA0153633.1 aspartate aminotransferase family protein [Winogradskyella vincentii]